jgi:hypothetical protein
MALSRCEIVRDAREEVAGREAVVLPAVGAGQIPGDHGELGEREAEHDERRRAVFPDERDEVAPDPDEGCQRAPHRYRATTVPGVSAVI